MARTVKNVIVECPFSSIPSLWSETLLTMKEAECVLDLVQVLRNRRWREGRDTPSILS